VGVGVGGLYCVDLPLVQEFMPTSKRGFIGGLVTCIIPIGVGLGSVLGAFMGRRTSGGCCSPSACCQRWSCCWSACGCPSRRAGLGPARARMDEARKSLAWAMEVEPASLPAATVEEMRVVQTNWFDLFKHPRSLLGVVARQCRRPDRRLRCRTVGAVAVSCCS